MKKTLAMLLVLVMLFSLCACNNSDSQTTDPSDSSQSTTNGTENTTGNTETPTDSTEGTQPPTDEPTTPPTDEPTNAPTDEPTTPPTQAPTETPTTPPTTCSHSWKDATCTAPKTCTKCGATEGSASGHSWKDATCTAPKTCSKCGATEGNATGHSWKDATCTAPKTCSKCGATEGNAKGHSYSNGSCSVCGTADPSFKQLTEGAWISGTTIYTFEGNRWHSMWISTELLTMDEYKAVIAQSKAEGHDMSGKGYYSLIEINGVRYAYYDDFVENSGGPYTVDGDTIQLTDEDWGDNYVATRIDGDTLKIGNGEFDWAAYQHLGDASDYLN